MTRVFMVLAVCLACSSAFAQLSPAGLWKTIDDKTGAPKSEVRITEGQGLVSAKIEKVYRADFKGDERCLECKDDRKDQPLIDGGARLEMRGFVGFSLLGRTQTWLRIQ